MGEAENEISIEKYVQSNKQAELADILKEGIALCFDKCSIAEMFILEMRVVD